MADPAPTLNLREGLPLLTPTMQRCTSQSPSRSSSGEIAEDSNVLPAPEVDITKTPWFIHPTVSMGPGLDAIYHNQVTIMKMLQDIRKTMARLLQFDAVQAPKGSRAATGGRTPATAYGREINDLFNDPDCSQMCVEWAWTDSTELSNQNKLAKIRSNTKLSEYAEATYQHFKDQVHLEWAMELDDIEDETVKKIVILLKSIEDDDTMKEAFHIALARAVNPSPARSPQGSRVQHSDNEDDDGDDAGEEDENDDCQSRMGSLKRDVRDSDDEGDTQGPRASKRQQLYLLGGAAAE